MNCEAKKIRDKSSKENKQVVERSKDKKREYEDKKKTINQTMQEIKKKG